MALRRLPGPLLALLLALALASCGSGGSGSESDGTAASRTGASGSSTTPETKSGGRAEGGDRSIQEFGSRAPRPELTAAAAVLHAYLDARAAGAWGAACERLAPKTAAELVRQLGSAAGAEKPGCGEVLAALSDGVPPAVLRAAAEVDVDALRAEGDSGFLVFRDADGEGLFIAMRREEGRWFVSAIAPSPLP